MSVNKVILVGRVGQDPSIKETRDGREIAYISLATSESWKDKTSGEVKQKSEWHRICIFNENLVNIVKNYIKKGSKLYVEGSIQTRKYDKDGVEKYSTDIILSNFNSVLQILNSKPKDAFDKMEEVAIAKERREVPKAEEVDDMDSVPF